MDAAWCMYLSIHLLKFILLVSSFWQFSSSTLGIYLKKTKTLTWKDMYISRFTVALFIIAKIWEQPKCSLMDEWIKIHTHTHTHIYIIHQYIIYILSTKKKRSLAIFNNIVDLEGFLLSKVSQTEKDKYSILPLVCGILKKKTNKKSSKSISSYIQGMDQWLTCSGWELAEVEGGVGELFLFLFLL